MAILMNIKDSIIDTIMYISPHDKPCPRKCGKLLPKKGEKKKSTKRRIRINKLMDVWAYY